MQIKTTIRNHLTPVRVAIIKKTRDNRSSQGCGEQETFAHCWQEYKLVQLLWKTVWQLLKKLKLEQHVPAISLAGIYPKKMKTFKKISATPCSL